MKNTVRIDFLHRQYMKKYQKWGNFVHLDEQGNDVFLFYRKEISLGEREMNSKHQGKNIRVCITYFVVFCMHDL